MCSQHMLRFMKEPDPRIFLNWGISACLGTDLYQIFIINKGVLQDNLAVYFDQTTLDNLFSHPATANSQTRKTL